MTERKPLPGGLASDVRHLIVELRELKDRAGLSLAALARHTPYSKSSWERYLNAKTLPPQHAVTALGKLADADPARLAALWDLANTAWHERDAHEATDEPEPRPDEAVAAQPAEPAPPARRRFGRRHLLWSAALALAAVVVSAAAACGAFGGGHSGTHAGGRDGSPGTDTATRQLDVNCFAESCTGKDPKKAGCGDVWTAALKRISGVYVELRYSDACKAAWSRISWGRPGDIARVVHADGRTYQRKVSYDTDTFSDMVAAASPTTAKACVLLTSGVFGCTGWGGTQHLTEAPNPPASMLTSATPSAAPSPGHS